MRRTTPDYTPPNEEEEEEGRQSHEEHARRILLLLLLPSRARVSRIRDARDRLALRDRVRVQIRVATRDDENALAERRAETNRGREQPEDDPQSRSAEENCRHAPEVGGFFGLPQSPLAE